MGRLEKIVFLPAFINDSLGDIPINRPLQQVKANGIAIFHQPYGASDMAASENSERQWHRVRHQKLVYRTRGALPSARAPKEPRLPPGPLACHWPRAPDDGAQPPFPVSAASPSPPE